MPRLVHQNPAYRKHRASGQAVVTIDGRDHYLGLHGTRSSRATYDTLIAEWLSNGRRSPVSADDMSIAELILSYFEHAQTYYRRPDGRMTSEVECIKQAMRPLKKLYAELPVNQFGPLKLKAVREEMIKMGWVRTRINHQVGRIRRMVKWGVENEVVPASILHGLRAVGGLMEGRSEAEESDPVKPVAVAFVEGVLPVMSEPVRAMVRLQLITGMRPGEVCLMRACDVDTSGNLWLYTPPDHKNRHRGHSRVIYLGPVAQGIVRPFLTRADDAYLFSPKEAEAARRAAAHAARKTPRTYGNSPGTNKSKNPKHPPGERYSPTSYNRAVRRACAVACPVPADLGAGLSEEKAAKAIEDWQQSHYFHVHQLRHTAATELRRKFGLESAQVILGHRTLSVTELYAEKNVAAAQRIMGEVG